MTTTTQTRYALGMGLILLVVIVAIIFITKRGTTDQSDTSASGSTNQTSLTDAGDAQKPVAVVSNVASSSDAGITMTVPMPSLTRTYVPLSTLPQSVKDADTKAVADAIAQLKLDPNHLAYWMQLAVYRKGAGDYAGAESIWLYAIERWPKDPTAYNDLADLYENFLHDNAKAVVYWNKLIAVEPTNIMAYVNLSTLYSITMHDAAAAKATIEKGLKANPQNSDLLNAQKAL